MRLLLGAARRRRDSLLRDAGRARRRQVRDYARRSARALRGTEGPCPGAGAASAAAGLHRRAGAALRLLLQRDHGEGLRTPVAKSQTDGRPDSRAHERPSLSLRHLSARHEGHQARVRQNDGRRAMTYIHTYTAMQDTSFPRRDPLKGGGALMADFRSAAAPLPAAAARGDIAGPPDPNAVDTWIAIHADNTATIYFGKCELGQGNTTGLLQIA